MSRLLTLTGATAMSLTLGLGAARADMESPIPTGTWCEDASACAEGETCLYGMCQAASPCSTHSDCWTDWCGEDGVCSEAPPCSADAECDAGFICDWGSCTPRGTSCLEDAECGAFAHCVFPDPPTVIEVDSGSSSSEGDGSDSAPAPPGSWDEEIEPPDAGIVRGECQVDVEAVPEDAGCVALCEAIAACASVSVSVGEEPSPAVPVPAPSTDPDEGGADEADAAPYPQRDPDPEQPTDPEERGLSVEEMEAFTAACTAMCSYGIAVEAPGYAGIPAAVSCVEAQTSCEAIETACEVEGESVGEMFDAVADRVEVDFGFGGSANDVGTPTSETDSGSLDPNAPKGTDQTIDVAPVDAGGCQGGGAGALAWAAVAGLGLLFAARRRSARVVSR